MSDASSAFGKADPSAALLGSTASSAPARVRSPSPPPSYLRAPRRRDTHTLSLIIALCISVFVLLAYVLGLSVPELVEPWRSLAIVTGAVGATYFAASKVLAPRGLPERERTNAWYVLFGMSYVGWALLVILVVRDRGSYDPLAMMLAVMAGLSAPITALVLYCHYEAEPERGAVAGGEV